MVENMVMVENKMKRTLTPILFALVLLSSISFVLGAVVMTVPGNYVNMSGSQTLTFTYVNGSNGDITSPVPGNITFYLNGTGSNVAITTATATTCTNTTCTTTATAGELPDGLYQTMWVSVGNASKRAHVNSTTNSTNLIIYTNNATCGFSTDIDVVEVNDPVGITTTQSSTKDTLFTLTSAWILYDPDKGSQDTSTSSTPTFSLEDFDQPGDFILSLIVTDNVNNRIACANKTITVQGSETGAEGTTGTLTTLSSSTTQGFFKNKTLLWVLGLGLFGMIIIIGSFFIIKSAKKR